MDDSRPQIEAAVGRQLPFDDAVLSYLLKVAPHDDGKELGELVGEFCPRWPTAAQKLLSEALKSQGGRSPATLVATLNDPGGFGNGTADFGRRAGFGGRGVPAESSLSSAAAQARQEAAVADEEADLMLARMLQEEEEAEAALAGAQQPNRAKGRPGKKGFRPLKIDYRVEKNAAPAQLGTAAPTSLADVLRNRRTQQGPSALASESFGPPAARNPSSAASAWAPPLQAAGADGLTWAERAQVAAEKAAAEEAAAAAAQEAVNSFSLRLRLLTSSGTEWKVDADPNESIGDIKVRIEKMHKIPFANQRILHMGRELADAQELRAAGFRDGVHTLQLALRSGAAEPPPAAAGRLAAAATGLAAGRLPSPLCAAPVLGAGWVGRTGADASARLKLRIRLPTGDTAALQDVPESVTASALKQRIQKDHGIRAEHLHLSFYGLTIEDGDRIMDCGVADGGLIDVALRPPSKAGVSPAAAPQVGPYPSQDPLPGAALKAGPKGKAQRRAQQEALASMQTSAHGRVLTEDEALEMALAASANQGASGENGEALDDYDDGGDYDVEDERLLADKEDQFHADVTLSDDKLKPMIEHAKRVASMHYREDYIGKVSKRSGYRLTILSEKGKKIKTILGFTVFRFRKACMNVIQVGLTGDSRGRGLGHALISWIVQCAKRANLETVMLVCPAGSVPFYQNLLFKRSEAQGLDGEDVDMNGQVIMEYSMRKGGKSGGGGESRASGSNSKAAGGKGASATSAAVQLSRVDLIREVHVLCDVDGDGALNADEMYEFALQTGFDGSIQEWTGEYEVLCTENGRSAAHGIDQGVLRQLCDDESDKGCYCSDVELRDMVANLTAKAKSRPRPQASSPSTAASRQDLVRRMFELLDKDGDGYLSCKEMNVFATLTGFEGSEAEWAEEYKVLADEFSAPPVGVDAQLLLTLVDDTSDAGCHCTDDELRNMLATLEAAQPPSTSMINSLNLATPQAPDATASRAQLVRDVFIRLDADLDGRLNEREMRAFATHSGFDGSDADWHEEFRALCVEGLLAHEDGVDFALFARLVDDESDNGCHCTDDELKDMLKNLKPPPPQPSPTVKRSASPVPPMSPREPLLLQQQQAAQLQRENSTAALTAALNQPPHMLRQAAPAAAARAELVRQFFEALDADGDGYLKVHEMRNFAVGTGFDGSDAEWSQEFDLLCKEQGLSSAVGLSFDVFGRLIDDESDAGQYCTDEELREMLDKVSRSPSSPSRAPAPAAQPVAVASFNSLPVDAPALRPAAAGTRAPVAEASFGVTTSARERLIRSVFDACDLDRDGRLNESEMWPIAEQTGFEGDLQVWHEEYTALCKDYELSPSEGFDHVSLQQLVDDDSDNGCYCSDDELHSILNAATAAAANAPARTNSQVTATFAPVERLPPKGESTSVPVPAPAVSSYTNGVEPTPLPPAPGRSELVRMVFRALDVDHDGQLNQQEMQVFATHIGFDGEDAEWGAEYATLCTEHGRTVSQGVNAELLEDLANDDSDSGCYCTDEELREMLKKLFADHRSRMVESLRRQANGSDAAAGSATSSRANLVQAVFGALDLDGNGKLDATEMLRFAGHIGFESTAAEWQGEYELLFNASAAHDRRPKDGVHLGLFAFLVDDTSEEGCHCTDEELEEMLRILEAGTRPALMAALFVTLAHGQSDLQMEEFDEFVRLATVAEGDDQWATRANQARTDGAVASAGISEAQFMTRVDGADGAERLPDSTLRAVLSQLRESAAHKSVRAPPGLPPPGFEEQGGGHQEQTAEAKDDDWDEEWTSPNAQASSSRGGKQNQGKSRRNGQDSWDDSTWEDSTWKGDDAWWSSSQGGWYDTAPGNSNDWYGSSSGRHGGGGGGKGGKGGKDWQKSGGKGGKR